MKKISSKIIAIILGIPLSALMGIFAYAFIKYIIPVALLIIPITGEYPLLIACMVGIYILWLKKLFS
jgi:hypothetical protein